MRSGVSLIAREVYGFDPFDEHIKVEMLSETIQHLMKQGAGIARSIDAIQDECKNSLKIGDKLIYTQNGSRRKAGDVLTFYKWSEVEHGDRKMWWQSKEMIDNGNTVHGLPIQEVDLFDPRIHKTFRIVTSLMLREEDEEFIKKFGRD